MRKFLGLSIENTEITEILTNAPFSRNGPRLLEAMIVNQISPHHIKVDCCLNSLLWSHVPISQHMSCGSSDTLSHRSLPSTLLEISDIFVARRQSGSSTIYISGAQKIPLCKLKKNQATSMAFWLTTWIRTYSHQFQVRSPLLGKFFKSSQYFTGGGSLGSNQP